MTRAPKIQNMTRLPPEYSAIWCAKLTWNMLIRLFYMSNFYKHCELMPYENYFSGTFCDCQVCRIIRSFKNANNYANFASRLIRIKRTTSYWLDLHTCVVTYVVLCIIVLLLQYTIKVATSLKGTSKSHSDTIVSKLHLAVKSAVLTPLPLCLLQS